MVPEGRSLGIAFVPVPTSSYGDTLNQLVNSTAPDKGVGLQLAIPIRNRAAQADQVRSQLEYRQAQMRLQQFIDGERDFDDAITVEEYVVPVYVLPDGTVTNESGNVIR